MSDIYIITERPKQGKPLKIKKKLTLLSKLKL